MNSPLLSVAPYDQRPWDDPLCLLALERCPWKDTDHDRGEGPRRENYCTWCEGFVTALLPFVEWATEFPDSDPTFTDPAMIGHFAGYQRGRETVRRMLGVSEEDEQDWLGNT